MEGKEHLPSICVVQELLRKLYLVQKAHEHPYILINNQK